ncbi:MAG: peptidoglycan-binding protein [Snowella sp.]|nr:peptidoglycan-binding protein [Snowella sp.]
MTSQKLVFIVFLYETLSTRKLRFMATHPNGIWIWNLAQIGSDYLDKLLQVKVKRVYLKVFDGKSNPMFWGHQCSTDIVKKFKDKDIQVFGWGYHYGTSNINAQVTAVKQAVDCGLDGYILDVEVEVENTSTHSNITALLTQLRPLVSSGTLGYTSFGHPGFHPNIPWKILDQHCDIALPQIYFEKFGFRATNEDEVQDCLKAHEAIGLSKPILPIWGSESDSSNPAKASELQSYLNRFPGSSIWRLPEFRRGVLERGQAWNLNYAGQAVINTGGTTSTNFELPILTRVLRRGVKGDDVKALQKVLNALGFNAGDEDGDFGPDTEKAVRAFQLKAGITVDGEVYTQTWKELSGKFDGTNVDIAGENPRLKLANFAENEAAKNLAWVNSSSEAEKYLEIFRQPMLNLGQIGTAKVFYDWCGAFVYYCCREVGIDVPIQPDGFWATMALVESWQYWATKKGFWNLKSSSFTPARGDIVVFDWPYDPSRPSTKGSYNHIAIVRGYTPGSATLTTSEGNKGNKSGNFTRNLSDVEGFIRITS